MITFEQTANRCIFIQAFNNRVKLDRTRERELVQRAERLPVLLVAERVQNRLVRQIEEVLPVSGGRPRSRGNEG